MTPEAAALTLDQAILIASKVAFVLVAACVAITALAWISYKAWNALATHYRCWRLIIEIVARKQGKERITTNFLEDVYTENPERIGPAMRRILSIHEGNH